MTAAPHVQPQLTLIIDGQECPIIGNCQTYRNSVNYRETTHPDWERSGKQDSCCCHTHVNILETRPWLDPAVPASYEVAGALIDEPDLDGHGFYIQPSYGSETINSGEPLEGYITFTVVSSTARGERYFLKWIHQTLNRLQAKCRTLSLKVDTGCPCKDEQETPLPEQEQPDQKTCPPENAPEETGETIYTDNGARQLFQVTYTGLDSLEETIHQCAGNRYKIGFEINECEWYHQPAYIGTTSHDCPKALNTGIYRKCQPTQNTVDQCVEYNRPDFNTSGPVTGTLNGLVCQPGKYSRPEKIWSSAVLTPETPASLPSVINAELRNISSQNLINVRVAAYRAVPGWPSPATVKGWKHYQNNKPVTSISVENINPGSTVNLNTNESTATNGCLSETINAEHYGDRLTCSSRYWIVLETPARPEYENLEMDAYLQICEPI